MTQRQVPHAPGELPLCSCGRPPRHIHDGRALRCGGGEMLECSPCDRRSGKHPTIEGAAREFCRVVGVPEIAVSPIARLVTRSARR